jgi:hypothetical protein
VNSPPGRTLLVRAKNLSRHDAFQFSPHYYSILEASIFAEWGLNQANTRRGVFRVKISEPSSLRRQR